MSTIHQLSGKNSPVLRIRQHPDNNITNTGGGNCILLPGECQKQVAIPVMVDAYNQYNVGVDVADQYQIYFDTQLISRCNWYPLVYWILETALINSLILYRVLPGNIDIHVDHLNFHFSNFAPYSGWWNPINVEIFFMHSGFTKYHSAHHCITLSSVPAG
jgi:hypothetical protein